MFEKREEIGNAVDRLFDATRSLGRGDVLTFGIIEEATGVARNSRSWKHLLHVFRKRVLRERRIAMKPIIDIGLLLLTESEQVKWCAENGQRRMYRQAGRSMRAVGAVPPESLSVNDQRLRSSQLSAMRSERRQIRQSVKQVVENSRMEVNPIRKSQLV